MTAPWKSHIGFKKEVTWGTALAPDTWVPTTSEKYADERRREVDKGKRGRASADFNSYDGTREGKPAYDFHFYPDECGRFFARIMGTDNVTGAGPYAHALTLLNGTPPSDTISDFYGIAGAERRFAGALLTKLDLHVDAMQGLIDLKAEWASWAPGAGNAESTPTFGTDAPIVGWQTTLKENAIARVSLLTLDLTWNRPVNLVFAASNSQDPAFVEVGQLELTGRGTFYAVDEVEYNLYRNNTQQPFEVICQKDASNILDVLMTKCSIEHAEPDRSREYVVWDATLRGLDNGTDNGPCKVTVTNGIAAAY